MSDIARGQRVPLSTVTTEAMVDVGVDVSSTDNLSFDISCFGVGADGALVADEWLVFFNNTRSPGEEVSALGPHGGDEQVFRVDLSRVPETVTRLVFTVNLDGEGAMAQIAKGHVRVLAGGAELLRYPYYGADFTTEQSIIAAELYRHDGWRFTAVGQGFAGGLDTLVAQFGGEVADGGPAPVPVPVVDTPVETAPVVAQAEPVRAPEPAADPAPEPAAAPPAEPAAPRVPEQIGPDLTQRVQYKLLTQEDSFWRGKFDASRIEDAISSYASMGWVVVGTATDRLGMARDNLMIVMERAY